MTRPTGDSKLEHLLADLRHSDWRRRIDAYRELARLAERGRLGRSSAPAGRSGRPLDEASMAASVEIGEAEMLYMVDSVCRGKPEGFVWAAAMGRKGNLAAMDLLHHRLRAAWQDSELSHEKHCLYAALYLLVPKEPLYGRSLLCQACYARFRTKHVGPIGTSHEGDPNERVAYPLVVTCRVCDKARSGVYGVDNVIAVLDQTMGPDCIRVGARLRLNWAKQRRLFDFDRVEIVNATDEDVETLCVLTANDTDGYRAPRYPTMTCFVHPGDAMSRTALNMLRSTFVGQVVEGTS